MCTLHVNVCKAVFEFKSFVSGSLEAVSPLSVPGPPCLPHLSLSRPLEKVRWALDYLANSAGEEDVSGNPSLENSGEQHPLYLSHPTQSYLGWDVAQALRNWCALCYGAEPAVQVYELRVHMPCARVNEANR